jgi:NADH-quinone oxidoreductase subunit C/D
VFNWKNFEASREIFSQVGPARYRDDGFQHHVHLRPQELLRWMDLIKDDLGFLTLVDVYGADHLNTPDAQARFEVSYQFYNLENHQRLNLHLFAHEGEIIPSIAHIYQNADWMEREVAEMFHLRFSRSMAALLLPDGQKNYPLRKDSRTSAWPIDDALLPPPRRYNPNRTETPYAEETFAWKSYPYWDQKTLGLFDWLVCYDPKKTVDSALKIGFHHQGFEKLLESKNWLAIMQLVDKLHLGAAPTYSIAWARNLEDSLRIKLPERAQAIRIVFLELARIADHLTVLSQVALFSEQEEHKLLIDAREKVYELFEKYCGHRQGFGITRLGGVREDLPHGWTVEYEATSQLLSKNLQTIHRALTSRESFREKLRGEPVKAQTILQMGITGPAMRASGLNFDLRKSQPFYFYQDIDFDIPVGIFGTSYDRYLLRHEEIFQSLRIITQVIDNLPLGDFRAQLDQDLVFDANSGVGKLPLSNFWHYSSLEAPNGEAGFFHLPKDGVTPDRVKIKSPSFVLAQALPQLSLGLHEDQLRTCVASLGLNKVELDR